jgi:hypothetical protein
MTSDGHRIALALNCSRVGYPSAGEQRFTLKLDDVDGESTDSEHKSEIILDS